MAEINVWCLLIDHEKKATFGGAFSVEVSPDASVYKLTKAIKQERPDALQHVAPATLIVWRCMDTSIDFGDIVSNDLNQKLEKVFSPEQRKVERLKPKQNVKQSSDNTLLIEVPVLESILQDLLPEDFEINSLSNSLTFSTNGIISTTSWYLIAQQNDFHRRCELPLFIRVIVERPRRAPDNDDPAVAVFNMNGLAEILNGNGVLSEEDVALPYTGWHLEILHFIQTLFLERSSRLWGELTEIRAHAIVLGSFERYWMEQVTGAECTFGTRLKYPLLAKETDNGEIRGFRKYWPRPDAAFLKDGLTRFLAEVDSHSDGDDKHRLHVQAACTLRFASQLRKDGSDGAEAKELFLMGAFFSKEWTIFRYFYFFDKDEKVHWSEEGYQVNVPKELMKFLFEFYNYSRYVQEDDKLGDKRRAIDSIADQIDGKVKKSLYTKDVNRGKKRTHPDSNQGGDPDKRTAISKALQTSGFVVGLRKDDRDLFEPIVKLPDNLVAATARNGEAIVAKLPRRNSEELSLLRELSRLRSPHNHVIPFLGTIESSLGLLIILPCEHPLSSVYMLETLLKGKAVQLCRELAEGVAFLHRRKIAHLDIKPENLVYSFKFRSLYIIDFDIAMRCEDVEDMVEISCGTPGWSAPEIVHDDDEPPRAFNPIRADLWSCGKTLEHILVQTRSTDKTIALLLKLLLDSDPNRRPFLHEVVAEDPDIWTSGRALQALESRAQGDKDQEAADGGDVRSKRRRNHAGYERSTAEVKKTRSSTAGYLSHSDSFLLIQNRIFSR